jgi:UDP-N-acetylmuramoyl-tripeptide--D-alanyl-D-alanine ligase
MRELGTATEQLHARTAEGVVRAMDEGIDRVVATGAFVPAFEPFAAELGSRLLLEPDPIAAFHQVAGELTGSETILLKASRGEALERWLPLLEEKFEGNVE